MNRKNAKVSGQHHDDRDETRVIGTLRLLFRAAVSLASLCDLVVLYELLRLTLRGILNRIVCVKVMDDIRGMMTKAETKEKPKIEAAMAKYCANKDSALSAREKKICYYIDPIKRDIAQPFSLGMPSLKVCKRITKSNPEICSVKYPVKTETMEKKDLTKLRVKQLKKILDERGVDYKGLLEKNEFVKKVQETEHLAGDEF